MPPHTTHALQPLDVGVFKPAKTSWNTIVNKFNHNNIYKPLDKFSFPALVKELISTLKRQYAISAFKKCGLFPLCREAMITDKIKLSTLFTPSTSNTPSQSNTSSLLSPFSSLLNNMTINQPTRTAKRRIEYLADMKGYADRINETAQNFQQSILEALKRETSNTDNSSRKRTRFYGSVYTEAAARQQLVDMEQEKLNKANELELRKKEREMKKLKKVEERQ